MGEKREKRTRGKKKKRGEGRGERFCNFHSGFHLGIQKKNSNVASYNSSRLW